MNARDIVQRYFELLATQGDWDSTLADDMVFTSFTSPTKEVRGRQPYLTATSGFYGSIRSVQLRELLVVGDRAVALTRYDLRRPRGTDFFVCDVAEVFSVKDGKITSLDIYFDSAPFSA